MAFICAGPKPFGVSVAVLQPLPGPHGLINLSEPSFVFPSSVNNFISADEFNQGSERSSLLTIPRKGN